MPRQLTEDTRLTASVDEGSETDVEGGNANDHNEAATFLQAFKGDLVPYDEPDITGKSVRSGSSKIFRLSCVLAPWALSIILFVAFISERLQSRYLCNGDAKEQYLLAQDHIEYRTELMYDGVDNRNPMSEYQGWPNDEKDKLWDQFDGAMVRINRQEAEKLPHLSQHVAVENYEDDFVVGMTFTHTMHCLNSLRKKMYPGRYHGTSWLDENGNITYDKWWHTDHCIEMLRRYITCHADTTAFTYDWIENTSLLVHPGTIHTCKNFDRVVDWLKERRINAPLRKHVENGKIVDYDNKPKALAWAEVELTAPDNWAYRKEDLHDTGETAPNAVQKA
ncbi:hypothetical protein N0V82_003271 [Gnomoniopsis sp. IMI 355080]|nr:hypothetical protein N0V82_003271 [Gnomoniopsis sp. IMI 355080]